MESKKKANKSYNNYLDLSVDPGVIELINSLKADPPKHLYIFLVKTNFKLRDYYSVGTFVL